jgi:hypothetical protein
MKKGSVRSAFMFLMVAFLILFAAGSFVANIDNDENQVTAHTININEKNTIQVPNSNQPVPNKDEGTLVLWTKPPVEIFDQFSDDREYLIFFSATNVPGLRIVYNLKESRFEAGTPILKSPVIDIFDGKNHQLVYTFKKGVEQAMFLDGQKVDSSEFKPSEVLTGATGFMVATSAITEKDIKGVEVAVYDRQMTGDDLAKV